LLDIEGTTTPFAFVADRLVPYARAGMHAFLEHEGRTAVVEGILAQLRAEHAIDADAPAVDVWPSDAAAARGAAPAFDGAFLYLTWLMDRDRKSPALKALQGLIWQRGYDAHELTGEVFDDVAPALRRWKREGRTIAIYSSGSVLAQRLLFASSTAGDLTPLIDGWFDTGVGPKREPASYAAIARALALPASAMLFVSDAPAEVLAARAAGLAVAMSVRPGNPVTDVPAGIAAVHSLGDVR